MARASTTFLYAVPLFMAGTITAQSLDYKRVMADELTRNFIGTGGFSNGTNITVGRMETPSSLVGEKVTQSLVNGSYEYTFPWIHWDIGDFQPVLRATLGGMGYDTDVTAPAPGLTKDETDGFAIGTNVYGGVRWRPWRHTTLGVLMSYGYLYSENNYHANNPVSQALAPQLDGSTRNWFSNAISSVNQGTIAQNIPLWPGAWDDSASAPTLPRLTISSSFASVANLSFWGKTNDQQRYTVAYVWTNGLELFVPLGAVGENKVFALPFFNYTSMYNDGKNSMSSRNHFYEAGLKIGFRDDGASWFGGNNAMFFIGSTAWGSDFSSWQISTSFHF